MSNFSESLNLSNVTIENQSNSTAPIEVFALGPPLVIISSIGIVIGTIFSFLCIVRYCREPELRTHYNYIVSEHIGPLISIIVLFQFHFMLIYCLFSSIISTPIFLIGYYRDLFANSFSLCQLSTVHYLMINIGMITSLAYASIERHFLIFQKNGILTWNRQLFPVVCLLIYSYIVAALFTVMPTCPYVPCVPCQATALQYMIPWLTLSFFFPESVVIVSTVYLLYRIRQQRAAVNRRVEWLISRRIALQMSIYLFWSWLYYCPVTFYNFSLLLDPSKYSAVLKSTMNIINTVSVQSYPILTFLSMILLSRKKQASKHRPSTRMLNHFSTISTNQPEPWKSR
jgi:hypothetical protein